MSGHKIGLLLPCALLAACGGPQPPSVLVITLDTTRADRLGPYGAVNAETPVYDAFAERGTRFSRAYSTCPLTIPSHSTIFTGRAPPSHGVRDNGDFILGPEQITLAERFSAVGYATAAFTAAFPTQARWGFDQGFDVYHDPLKRLPTELDWRDERRAQDVVDDALQTLPALDGPIFAWVHLFDAHWPYEPPEPWASRFPGRPYEGEIAYASDQVGRLIEWFEENRPGTIIAITADHGEGLGDGGEQTHGFLLHDGTIRVPLMLAGPGVPAGQVIDDPVSHVDIAPTLLRLAGLEPHPEIQGRSLLEGGSPAAYSEALTGQFSLGLAPLYGLTDENGRYTEGSYGAFYPAADDRVLARPDGVTALAPYAERLAATRAALDEVIAQEAALTPEMLEQLAALGYMGGDHTAEAGTVDPRDVIDIIPLTWQIRQAMGMGRLDVADRMLARLQERMPGTYGVDLLAARLMYARGRWEEAGEALTDLFGRAPSSTVALQIAGVHASAGRWAEAESWFSEALAIQPASPEAMGGRVRALLAMGEVELGGELAERYLAIYPDHADLALARAELLLLDGRVQEAYEDAAYGLARLPRQPEAYAIAARCLWALGEADEALEALSEALRLNPHHLPARLQLAEWLLEVGRNAEAVRTIAPATRLLPDEPAIQELAARAQAALAAERGGR